MKLDLIYVIYGFLGLILLIGWIQEEVRAWLKNRKRRNRKEKENG
ncbi:MULTISPECIES: hypothetical protein [unclassified Candidatus Paralachnospira]